jgi:hypothetical protein
MKETKKKGQSKATSLRDVLYCRLHFQAAAVIAMKRSHYSR